MKIMIQQVQPIRVYVSAAGVAVKLIDRSDVRVRVVHASGVGPAGPGIPAGGTTGQVLVKDSNADYDTSFATDVSSEVPSGTINGVNATFTLANTPLAGSVRVFRNGLRCREGGSYDYTVASAVITFNAGSLPQTNDVVLSDYRY